ncbi:bcl-2-related ovarian killer protein isoform X2 [Nasonia vitripennis]|uniref:Bcl-2 Bcl-2 homology region 1-3 domain-containing protein n=1 Tax=Nasonia vitripennis TaxID=7425 RepID=A0A7M7H7Q2_NASVI|nr:bcl-2-related ovarian killer protein isoform X2 [Nasonia vitripennis]
MLVAHTSSLADSRRRSAGTARARKRRPVSMVIMQHPPPQIRHTTSTEDVSAASSVAAAAALARSYRRSSLAATLHANFISLGGHPDAFDAARRRLSNVSDVVSRKISRTIGWRSLSVSVELTVSQGKALCGQYIRSRLRRSGIFHRKLGLKRVRSAKLISGSSVVEEVFPVLDALGTELEKMHPQLYERVGRQIGRGLFNSEQKVSDALTDISREMLRAGECNWVKIASIYAVAGGIAVDCVKQGKPEFLPVIQRAMIIVLEEYLASWIQANGGWTALVLKYRPAPRQTNWQAGAVIFFGLVAVIWAILCFAVAFKASLL